MKLRFLVTLCSVISFTPAFGAVTLVVNTTADEFGENTANCSLREAIESVNTRSAFGGCIAGQRYGTNTIRLEAKEYLLTRGELILQAEMTIVGIGYNSDLKDSITGRKPQRHAPTTTINAQNKSRLFNSALYKSAITLYNLKLINGYSDDSGGAILAGGSISTSNVVFENNTAKNTGGALYLIGKDATLTSSDSLWKNNNVALGAGAAIAMSCFDDLKPTTRTMDIIQTSFVQNGNTSASSIIEACGVLVLNIKTSTIGENTATGGAIINFNDNTSLLSSVNIESSTLVQNKIAPIVNFNTINRIAINSSVIAFNEGQACIGNQDNFAYLGSYNLLQGCDYLKFPPSEDSVSTTDVHLSSPLPVQFSNEFNPLGNYGGYTPTYLPKMSSTYVRDKGGVCVEHADQRGSAYATAIICDLGAVERRTALAVVDETNIYKNNKDTDRIAEVSVLDNDIPSETDLTDDKPDARGAIAKDAAGKYLLELSNNSNGQCTIVDRSAEDLLPLIRFDNGGQLFSTSEVYTCEYTFTDINGVKATAGKLSFQINNQPPIANDDSFTLSSESPSLVMNVVSNDNDSADGKYGSLCTADTVKCNGGYYIRVVSNPTVGTIEGDRRECPDYTDTNKYLCYRGDLTYRPKNTLSPFNDSFTYVVYDSDLAISNAATVTIINQTGVDEANSSGSFGLFSVISLAGLALYRRRKYHFV